MSGRGYIRADYVEGDDGAWEITYHGDDHLEDNAMQALYDHLAAHAGVTPHSASGTPTGDEQCECGVIAVGITGQNAAMPYFEKPIQEPLMTDQSPTVIVKGAKVRLAGWNAESYLTVSGIGDTLFFGYLTGSGRTDPQETMWQLRLGWEPWIEAVPDVRQRTIDRFTDWLLGQFPSWHAFQARPYATGAYDAGLLKDVEP